MTTSTISPLRQRMLEDMNARKLGRHSQRSHLYSCERFAAFLKRSPTATADDVRRFQLHLIENGASICNRNRIMTGVRFLLRLTLRRHDLAAEVKLRAMLALSYGCGLRAGEIVRLKADDILDSRSRVFVIGANLGRVRRSGNLQKSGKHGRR